MRDEGRQRLYRLNGHALKPTHDWVKSLERTWSERFDRLDAGLEELEQEEEVDGADRPRERETPPSGAGLRFPAARIPPASGPSGGSGGVLDPEGAHLAALRRLADFGAARVCEVGCGDGRLTTGIAREAAAVFALDPDASAVAEARRRLPRELDGVVTYEVGSAREIEIPKTEFDLVVFSWSL